MNQKQNISPLLLIPIVYLILAILSTLAFAAYGLFAPSQVEQILETAAYQNFLNYFQGGILISIFILVLASLIPYIQGVLANARTRKYLEKSGKKIQTKVLKIDDLGIRQNHNPYVEVTVETQPGVEAKFRMTMSLAHLLRPGDMIEVLYDPSNPTTALPLTE